MQKHRLGNTCLAPRGDQCFELGTYREHFQLENSDLEIITLPQLRAHPSSSEVEAAFSRAVSRAGGLLVSDLLPSRQNLPKNADFVFRDQNAIGELKILKESALDAKEFARQISPLYRQWILEGKVPPAYGVVRVDLQNLPPDCAKIAVSILRKPIYRRVRKADKQVKSTKRLLNMPDARGILFLIQDGDRFLSPEMVLYLLHHSLHGDRFLKNIDDIALANGDMPALMPGDPLRYQFFLHSYRTENEPMVTNLVHEIGTAWKSELEVLIGTSIGIDRSSDDPRDVVPNLRYFRDPSLRRVNATGAFLPIRSNR